MVPGREFSSLPRRRRRNPLRLSMNRPRHWSVLSSWRQTWFVSRIIKKKWIAFVGLKDGKPYEIFTGLADDDDGIFCPKNVVKGKIVKAVNEDGTKRYDFQFSNKRGYKTTIEGLSDKFNPEYWNYAKLISGVLRYGMPIPQVLKLVSSLELDSQSINSWKKRGRASFEEISAQWD